MWFVLKISAWFVHDTLKLGQVHVYIAMLSCTFGLLSREYHHLIHSCLFLVSHTSVNAVFPVLLKTLPGMLVRMSGWFPLCCVVYYCYVVVQSYAWCMSVPYWLLVMNLSYCIYCGTLSRCVSGSMCVLQHTHTSVALTTWYVYEPRNFVFSVSSLYFSL